MYRLPTDRRYLLGAGAVHGTAWDLDAMRGNAVMAMLTLAVISTVSALQVFGKDRLIFWRERACGAYQSCMLKAFSVDTAGAQVTFPLPLPYLQPPQALSCKTAILLPSLIAS